MIPRYTIGQQYLFLQSKHPNLCTITEILTTTNSKGEVVKIRYTATHEFAGQVVTDHDVNEVTIAMGIDALKGRKK